LACVKALVRIAAREKLANWKHVYEETGKE